MKHGDLVQLAPSELTPWSGNPRQNAHAVDAIADSIREFGFGAPILARMENLEIIAGHTRHEAALLLGLERVPVVVLDLDELKAHRLAIADNKLGELAEWDALLLGELADGGIDLSSLWFDGIDLESIISASLDDDGDEDGWDTMRNAATTPTARSVVVSVHLAMGDVEDFERLIESSAKIGEVRAEVVMRALRSLGTPDE